MAFFITLIVLAGVGWILRACFPQAPQAPMRNWQQQQPMQRGPSYLGTGLAVAGGMIAADLITDQFTGEAAAADAVPIEHDVAPIEHDIQPDADLDVDVDAPEVDAGEWDFGSFF